MTDKVQVTRNGGGTWTDVTRNIVAAGGPADVWTSRVYASRFAAGTAFVAKTGRAAGQFRTLSFQDDGFRRDMDRESPATCRNGR